MTRDLTNVEKMFPHDCFPKLVYAALIVVLCALLVRR